MKTMKRILVLCLVASMCLGVMVLPARAVFGTAEAGAYVDQLYQGLLGRPADDAGKLTYVNKLVNDKVSAAHIAELIVGSAEFRSRQLTNEQYIDTLYQGLLGRSADAAGMATFKGAMDVGNSRTWVFQQIIASQEFKNLCENKYNMFVGDYSTGDKTPDTTPTEVTGELAEQYVRRLYVRLLDREPDANGLAYWVAQLTYKKMSAAGVAAGIASGNEFNSLPYTNGQFVQRVYLALLNREPDTTGYTNFVSALNSGKTRAWVFAAICASQEFQNLFGEMNAAPGNINSTTPPTSLISGGAVNPTDASAYVERLYLCLLDRYATAEEVDHWTRYLTTRSMSAAGVAAAIASSSEARSIGRTREVFVSRVYEALLNRAPDVSGMGTYVNALANGYSRSWVFAKICQSSEFQNMAEYRNMNVVPGYVNSASYDMG